MARFARLLAALALHVLPGLALAQTSVTFGSDPAAVTVGENPDLSPLSDFGRPDIPSMLGIAPTSGNRAGILQQGSSNTARIEQRGGTGNNAELWQIGVDLEARLFQNGAGNVVRIDQQGSLLDASLQQTGVANELAVHQVGSASSLTGLQEGTGNQAALYVRGNSTFDFAQQGNYNQLSADLPAGTSMQVRQTGDYWRTSIAPAP